MSKNHTQFNREEIEVMDKIIATLTIKLCSYLENYKDPRQWNKDLSEILVSDNILGASTVFLNINNMDPSKPLSPQDINKEVAKKLAEESETYLTPPALSRVLKRLEEDKIVVSIKGKKMLSNKYHT